ncbi:MAG: hypothetical protein ACI4EF_04460, partial [Coprococcus sp.]
ALSHFAVVSIVIYLFYIIIYGVLIIISHNSSLLSVNPCLKGFGVGILISAVISAVAVTISMLPLSLSGCSLLLFVIILITAYTGGLLVPELLLPEIFKKICPYTPGNAIVHLLCKCIYI